MVDCLGYDRWGIRCLFRCRNAQELLEHIDLAHGGLKSPVPLNLARIWPRLVTPAKGFN